MSKFLKGAKKEDWMITLYAKTTRDKTYYYRDEACKDLFCRDPYMSIKKSGARILQCNTYWVELVG